MDAATQIWIVMEHSSNLELNEPIFCVGMNVKELTHSQQQPQAPNAHKKKPTIRLTTRVTMLCDTILLVVSLFLLKSNNSMT